VNPITDIDLIEIFPATYDEFGMAHFPVHIDLLQLTFHLDEDACWTHMEAEEITDELKQLIGDLIERNHD